MAASTQKTKRSPALVAGIILVFLLLILTLTLAMFASFDEVTNRIEAGRVDIVLTETKWDPSEAKNIVPNAVLDKNPRIINNEETDVYVFLKVSVPYGKMEVEYNTAQNGGTLIGSGNEVPYYKFVVTNENPATHELTDSEDTTLTSAQTVHSRWKLLTNYPIKNTTKRCYEYLYAYVREDDATKLMPLAHGFTTQTALFDKVHLMNFRERAANPAQNDPGMPDPNRNVSILVEAYGIQANFLAANNQTSDDPDTVWGILSGNS